MDKALFKIIEHGSMDWEKAVSLREKVLRKPQGAFFTVEELQKESNDIQVAGFIEGRVIACAVLVEEGAIYKMQRVAVSEELRNQKIGKKLLEFCNSYAIKNGISSIYCHARNTAVKFYSENGYIAEGDYFDEDGIPHLKMRKILI
ncbi:GNAT family N-acetyltransferase [bacterium]|nr:GNAT family N-acetyltransferase [bacterium]